MLVVHTEAGQRSKVMKKHRGSNMAQRHGSRDLPAPSWGQHPGLRTLTLCLGMDGHILKLKA